MKLSREKRVGIFFIVGIAILLVLLEMTAGQNLFVKKYALKTHFKSVSGLKIGDPVKLAGVDVGKVSSVSIVPDMVEVQMSLREGTPVRADSVATIKTAS